VLRLADNNLKDVLPLADPTLFALPHREGFSGAAWLSAPTQEIQPFAWTEPVQFLELPDKLTDRYRLQTRALPLVEGPAGAFPEPVAPRASERLAATADFPPELFLAKVNESGLFADHSAVRQTGGLEGRGARTRFDLPSWPHSDVLTNSVVQVLVDSEGRPFSAILIGPGSGSKEADDFAVRQARGARFAPLPRGAGGSALSGLAWGELVFEWHTLPASNGVAAKQ
jgi:hypothetical protein